MDINAANIRALNQGATATFTRSYEGYTPLYPRLTMKTPAAAGFAIYTWLGALPSMRAWKGKLERQALASNKWQVDNEAFSMSWDIARLEVTRDQYGLYTPLFAQAGQNAAIHPDILMATMINEGFTRKCYNGKNFFDSDHLHVKGVQAGKFTNKSDKKLTGEYYDAARASLGNVKDPSGVPFNMGAKLLLIVGEELRGAAELIINARDVSGSTNTRYQTSELIVNPLITGTNWCLANVGGAAKPFVFQEEEKTRFTSLVDPQAYNLFEYEAFSYKAFGVYTVNYALPQMAYGSTGTQA